MKTPSNEPRSDVSAGMGASRDLNRLALASALPLLALVLQWFLWPVISPLAWFLFYPAVYFSVWVDGLRGGLVATLLSAILVVFVFMPYLPPDANHIVPALSTALFLLLGALFSYTNGRLRKATSDKVRLQSAALEAAANAIVITKRDGRIEWANRAFTSLTGYPPAQALGKRPGELLKSGLHDGQFYKDMWDTIAAGEVWHGELQNRRLSGEIYWEDMTITPVRDTSGKLSHFVAVKQDISRRKEADLALLESESRFRELTEHIQKVFFLVDPQMKETYYVNPAYETIWGRSSESLQADPSSFLASIHPDDSERARVQIAPEGVVVPFDVECRIIRPDGTTRWVNIRAFPVAKQSGEVYRYACTAEDVTLRKETESILRAREEELEKTKDRYRQAQKLEAIGRLSGGIAHDFNNLLTVILGNVSILDLDELSDDARASIQQIKGAADRAANLTRQLLVFARRQSIQIRRIDLNRSIEQIGAMIHRVLGEDIEIQIRYSESSLWVDADPDMIDQILMNLAVNARDAMPRGGRLIIETASKFLDEESAKAIPGIKPGPFCVLSVTDTGSGIPAEVLPHIFDPFFTTKEVGKGTGLGLATVFAIMQQHGGWINTYSEVGRGTTFRAHFPSAVGQRDESPVAGISSPAKGGSETILVIEDEAGISDMVSAYMRRLGYNVMEARTGPEAIEQWANGRDIIRLVLTDMVLPGGMTGIELAVRMIAEAPDIKVIYTSGYSELSVEGDFFLQEGVNFLAKPYELSRLAQLVRMHLDAPKI